MAADMILVAMPCFTGDVHLLLKNLQWQAEFCGQQQTQVVLSCDPALSGQFVQQLEAVAQKAFKSVRTFVYPHPRINGWPQGPNWVFQHTARFMEQFGSPWLFMEPDAVPVKPNWLQALDAEYKACGRRFMGVIVPDFNHCNGVAIYPHDTPRRIPNAMQTVDLAWDTVMRPEMINDCHAANHLIAHAWGCVDGKLHPWDGPPPQFRTQASLNQIDPRAVLVHRDKFALIIDRLREQRTTIKMDVCLCEKDKEKLKESQPIKSSISQKLITAPTSC